ncbi:MAG TPA: hypothetical protein VF069_05940 [Streptosporangiaceae bacterium]
MTSIRERLEAKRRRTAVVPVLVSDPSEDQQAAVTLQQAHALRLREEGYDSAVGAAAVEAAAARVREHWADVHLQSLPPAEWEMIVSTHTGETGIDWDAVLALLLAHSCIDPDLRDEEWWAARLADDAWSAGDTAALKRALLLLNVDAFDPYVPKG